MKNIYIKLIMISFVNIIYGQIFSISRVHYGGGGDWYSNPSSIPNLLNYLTKGVARALNKCLKACD